MTDTRAEARPEPTPLADEVETALARHDLVVIGVLLVATFVVVLNETVMSVALPVLQTELGVDPSVGQWLTTAFLLTMGVVIPLTGYLISRLGTRTLFGVAMSLFSAGTLLATLAPGFGVLLAARVVQASGTALMLPLLMTTIMTLVPPARRGVMMGNIAVVISVAPALGPTLSGIVLEHLGWRWVFGLVVPVALLALALGLRLVRPVAAPRAAPVDLVSVPLAVLGFGGLVYGLVSLGHAAEGAGGLSPVVPFAVGGVALAAFLLRQLRLARTDRALLDLRVFASRQFSVAMAAMLVAMAAMMGTFILVPYYAQTVLGMGPTSTGLLTLPGGILMGIAGPVVGRVYDARGPRVLLLPGAALISAALWMLATIGADTSVGWLLAAYVVLCLGLAVTFTPLMTAGLGSVRPALYAHGSAVLGTFQQVAGAAGTALFVTVMTVVSTRSAEGGATTEVAVADGVRSAFLVGACVSLLLLVVVTFVRKPAPGPEADGAPLPH